VYIQSTGCKEKFNLMLFIARFTNNTQRLAELPQFYPAHVEWLKKNEASILVPGAIRTDPDAPPLGGLWIVRAESKAEVEALFKTDPFWVNGLRQGYEILYWYKAFPDKAVPI
jgi:uncharacterized protein